LGQVARERRHSRLETKKVKASDWDRHERNTFLKIIQWFEAIGKVLKSTSVTYGDPFQHAKVLNIIHSKLQSTARSGLYQNFLITNTVLRTLITTKNLARQIVVLLVESPCLWHPLARLNLESRELEL
jgi:hypothetical protein